MEKLEKCIRVKGAHMSVIQNFQTNNQRVQDPVVNTAVEAFAANPIRKKSPKKKIPIRRSTLQSEGKFV